MLLCLWTEFLGSSSLSKSMRESRLEMEAKKAEAKKRLEELSNLYNPLNVEVNQWDPFKEE